MNAVSETRMFVYHYLTDNMKLEIVRLGTLSVVRLYHLSYTQSVSQTIL
jgi:hypothetical protein